jgi:hypothetical protein
VEANEVLYTYTDKKGMTYDSKEVPVLNLTIKINNNENNNKENNNRG